MSSDSEDDNPFGNVQQTLRSLQFNGLNKKVCDRFLNSTKDIDDCIVLSDTDNSKVPSFDDCIILTDTEVPKILNKKERSTRTDKSAELVALNLLNKAKKRKRSSPGVSPNNTKITKQAPTLQELNNLLRTTEKKISGRDSRGGSSTTAKRGRGRRTQSGSSRGGITADNLTSYDNTHGNINVLEPILPRRGRARPSTRSQRKSCGITDKFTNYSSISNTYGYSNESEDILPRRGSRTSTRSRRNTSRVTNNVTDYINIGNTDEYADELENTPLFNSKADDVIILDDSILNENKVLSVTVHWKCIEMIKFNIRKFQKITEIYKFFANKENVNENNLLFVYNNEILKPEDTPDSIGYREGRLIEGGIVNMQTEVITIKDNKKKEIGISLHFQCQNMKHPFVVTVKDNERLSVAMIKCAEYMELPINQLKFEFDGDVVSGKQTANDLELEGGECIDVKIMK